MSDRAKFLMSKIWESRDNGADTEEKLVSVILENAIPLVKFYYAQDNMVVLDKEDLLNLSKELLDGTD